MSISKKNSRATFFFADIDYKYSQTVFTVTLCNGFLKASSFAARHYFAASSLCFDEGTQARIFDWATLGVIMTIPQAKVDTKN